MFFQEPFRLTGAQPEANRQIFQRQSRIFVKKTFFDSQIFIVYKARGYGSVVNLRFAFIVSQQFYNKLLQQAFQELFRRNRSRENGLQFLNRCSIRKWVCRGRESGHARRMGR